MVDVTRETALITADMVVFTLRQDCLHVVLVRRGGETEHGKWALPGAFLKRGESAEEAAYRGLREEIGIQRSDVVLEQLKTYSLPSRDPRPVRAISVAWLVLGANLPEVHAATGALDARWLPVDEALAMTLAFDHDDILADGIGRARAKLEYTCLATCFLEEEFTMSDLRSVYEAVWGGPLEPANFHRKVLSLSDFVEPLGRVRVGRGRPAKLYRAGTARTIHPPLTRVSILEENG